MPPTSDHPAVLLLTHSGDFFVIDRVIEALERRGARPVRFDTDRFPRQLGLSFLDAADTGQSPLRRMDLDGQEIDAAEVEAVWTRSLWPPDLGEELDPEHRAACSSQAREAMRGFFLGLDGARWINDLHAMARAENKLVQLRAARRSGLTIPRTLITNEPERVRRFHADLAGRVVTKLLAGLTFGMHRTEGTFHTSEVGEEDLEHLDGLRYSPMIFQEKVDKDCELRVMYIAGRTFAGAVRAAGTRGATDWRRAEVTEAGWEPAEIPEELIAAMGRFMAELGIRQGAFDFIRTPGGEHMFLEVNPVGEWGMLERDLNLPITEAVADALVGYRTEDEG